MREKGWEHGEINGNYKGSAHCAEMIRLYSGEVLNCFELGK